MGQPASLRGLTVVVTGATRGIGAAIAAEYARGGATVIGVSSGVAGDLPSGSEHWRADLSAEADVEALAARIRGLGPDVIVNNAGINTIGPFSEIPAAEFKAIQQVNVIAPFLLCQACIPAMTEKGWGRIINISSIWGKISREGRASYSASKFALDGLTISLAAEHSKNGILANCVSPGFIDTALTRSVLTEEQIAGLVTQVPARRLGTVEEVAKFVVWLGGPENTFVTGQNLAIDGGFTRV